MPMSAWIFRRTLRNRLVTSYYHQMHFYSEIIFQTASMKTKTIMWNFFPRSMKYVNGVQCLSRCQPIILTFSNENNGWLSNKELANSLQGFYSAR